MKMLQDWGEYFARNCSLQIAEFLAECTETLVAEGKIE